MFQRHRWLPGVLLGLILLLALGLRGVLVPHGLPMLFHEDEPIYFFRTMAFGHGDWDPHYFKKPSFFLYLYFAFYYALYTVQHLLGYALSWSGFEHTFWQNPTAVAWVGRSLSVLFSVASVWWTYRLGKRVFNTGVGLLAALLLTLSVTHLKYTPIVLADIPALFFILATAWFALNIYDKGRWRDYLLCGACVALTMSFKYNAFSGVFLLAAHFLRVFPDSGRTAVRPYRHAGLSNPKLWAGIGVAAGLFLLLNPFVLLNASTFLADVDLERRHMIYRNAEALQRGFVPFVSLFKVFFKILPRDLGWFLYLAGWGGLVWSLARQRNRPAWVLMSFVLVFLLMVSQFRLVNAKYLLPVIPFWLVMAAAGIQHACSRLLLRQPAWVVGMASLLALVGLAWPMAAKTYHHLANQFRPDTRIVAREDLTQTLANGELVYVEPKTLPLVAVGQGLDFSRLVRFHDTVDGFEETHVLWPEKVDFRTLPAKTVVLQLRPYRGEVKNSWRLPYPEDYYQSLKQHYRLAHVYNPYRNDAPNESRLGQLPDLIAIYEAIRQPEKDRVRTGPILLVFERL